MRENIKMFKTWYNLAKPHKGYWIYQFVTVAIPSVCLLSEAMFAAKVTTSLADSNYNMAIICTSLVLFFMFLRALSWDLNYRNTVPLVGVSYKNIQSQIFEKIIKGKEKNFSMHSKEKLINIFHSEVYDVAKFSDTICNKFRYLFQIILTIGYMFGINIPVGCLLIIVLIINYFITDRINNSISKANKKVKETIDDEFLVFSKIIDSKYMLEDLNITKKMKDKYRKSNDNFLKAKHELTVKTSYLDNYFFLFCRIVIYVGTLFLVFLLSHNLVTLTVYFVIVSYLTDSVTNSIDFLSILKELKNAYVATNRVNIILNFDLKEELPIGNLNKDDIEGEIDFVDVSYKPTKEDIGLSEIKNINFHIPNNKIVLFKGTRSSGKRTIFYLMRRVIAPDSGNCYIDKINIMDFNKKVYRTNINYIVTKPYFYDGTVYSNLKLVCNNKEKIIETLKSVTLFDDIIKKGGLETKIKDLSLRESYLLSFARLLLMNSEILVLYEFPSYLSNKDEELIKKVLKTFKGKKTIIIFSANENCKEIADKVYNIEKGQIK
ncbi:MAG: ABC transporter ATP-binding protein [Bacilli bacterium]|nr:ABC transporter ATP-binding protein [Bacilli bacterium]